MTACRQSVSESDERDAERNMAKAQVGAAGIETISGALKRPKKIDGHNHGNYLVMTHRTAESTNPNCQRIYSFAPDRYKRSVPFSPEEVAHHNRFKAIAQAVAARRADLSKVTADQQAFAAQRDLPNGKKTMKSYLWSICAAEIGG